MNTRGTYGNRRNVHDARVGNVIYHSVGDIEDAVKQLAADYDAAFADIGHQVGVLPFEGSGERVKKHPDWYMWWAAVASPLFDRFIAFRREMLGGTRTFADAYIAYTNRMKVMSWSDEIDAWYTRLVDLGTGRQTVGHVVYFTGSCETVDDAPGRCSRSFEERCGGRRRWSW